jgi:hypothetical protein
VIGGATGGVRDPRGSFQSGKRRGNIALKSKFDTEVSFLRNFYSVPIAAATACAVRLFDKTMRIPFHCLGRIHGRALRKAEELIAVRVQRRQNDSYPVHRVCLDTLRAADGPLLLENAT